MMEEEGEIKKQTLYSSFFIIHQFLPKRKNLGQKKKESSWSGKGILKSGRRGTQTRKEDLRRRKMKTGKQIKSNDCEKAEFMARKTMCCVNCKTCFIFNILHSHTVHYVHVHTMSSISSSFLDKIEIKK